jgi:amidohydrolase
VAAEIVQALQLVVSRQTDARDPAVLTIGSIHGGNRHNIIAEAVELRGTLRTLDARQRADVQERMARTVAGVAQAHGTTAVLRFVGEGNPPTVNDAALTRASVPSLARVFGAARTREVRPQMGAEDFARFAERVPALYVKLGVRNQAKGFTAMVHTEDFDLDEDVLPLAVRAMATLVWDHLARAGTAGR